jgi:adenylylsulfate kinase
MDRHIVPANGILQRASKEALLNQRAVAIWLTGLSGSGKTTLAIALEKELAAKGKLTQVLDGDNVRLGLNNNLGFSEADRAENIRRIAEVARLFVGCGVITICCFVSPTNRLRSIARDLIGKADFLEIYVNAPLALCEQRDVKGLYAKARKGEISDFTGVDAPFEVPEQASLELNTATMDVAECVRLILALIER